MVKLGFASYEEAEEAGWIPFIKSKPINPYELGGIRSPEY